MLAAAKNVLGDCPYQVESTPRAIVLSSSGRACLQKVHDQLRDRHVRDAVRRLLLKSIEGSGRLRLLLNRQAAFVGVVAAVSSGEESPLGPIVLEVDTRDPEAMLDWLTFYRTAEPRGPVHPARPSSP